MRPKEMQRSRPSGKWPGAGLSATLTLSLCLLSACEQKLVGISSTNIPTPAAEKDPRKAASRSKTGKNGTSNEGENVVTPTPTPTSAPDAVLEPAVTPTGQASAVPTTVATLVPTPSPTPSPAVNTSPSGSITCATPHVAVAAGSPYGSFACTGASDADAGDTLTYSLATSSGTNCPFVGATGIIAGATPAAAGSCEYTVRACDASSACTAASVSHFVSVFSVSSAFFGSPSLDAQCKVDWSTTNTLSANLSSASYGGGSSVTGANVTALSNKWTLDFSTPGQPVAGSHSATYGLLGANLDGVARSGIFSAATPPAFSVTATANATTAQLAIVARSPAIAGTIEGMPGREMPRVSTVCHTCTSTHGYGQIAAGMFNSCALTSTGGVMCWGRHNEEGGGAVGNGGASGFYNTPQQVTGLTSGVKAVSVTTRHACAIVNSGVADEVKCWGSNEKGQLGVPLATTQSLSPAAAVTLPMGTTPVQIEVSTHSFHQGADAGLSCALLAPDGKLACWGSNTHGQFADGTTDATSAPTPVVIKKDASTELTGVKQFTLGRKHACAVVQEASESNAYCWGQNDYAQLALPNSGGGAVASTTYATKVTSFNDIVQLTAAVGCGSCASEQSHTCALRAGGTVHCWGADNSGQLGDAAHTNGTGVPTPVQVSGITSAVQISAGHFHNCALLADSTVQCWGKARGWPYDGSGNNLGDSASAVDSETPVVVKMGQVSATDASPDATTPLTDVVAIEAGAYHSCALMRSGAMKCWGQSENRGGMGNNANGSVSLAAFVRDPAAPTLDALVTRVRMCTKWDVSSP